MTANSTLKELFGSIRAEDLEERTRVVFAKEARNYVKAPAPGAGIPSMPFPTPVCRSCCWGGRWHYFAPTAKSSMELSACRQRMTASCPRTTGSSGPNLPPQPDISPSLVVQRTARHRGILCRILKSMA